jgi:hypothetical protein
VRPASLFSFAVRAVLLGLVVLLAWFASLALRQTPGTRVVLASGTEVRVLGISYGARHHRPGWGRLLPGAVREPVERALGQWRPGVSRFTSPAPAMVVWVDQQTSNTTTAEVLTLALADESGFFSGEPASVTIFGSFPGVSAHSFPLLPRRSRTLKLVAMEAGPTGKHRRLAEIAFPNPARGEFPHWEPQTLPASQTNAGLACTLRAIKTGFGISSSSSYLAGGTNRVTHSRADEDAKNRTGLALSFRDTLAPSNAWELTAVRVSDATGNVATNSSLGSNSTGDSETRYTFGPGLWPGETWELGLTAARKPGSAFAPGELLTFSNVPLPALNQTNPLGQVLASGATSVRLISLRRRAPLPADNPGWSSGDLSELKLAVSNLPPDVRFTLVQARDDEGRVLESPSWSWTHAEPSEAGYSFRRIEETASSLNVTFAVHPTRRFTFRLRPEIASTNDFTPSRD